MTFYSDMIPKIETNISKMRNAYFSYVFKIDRAYQKRDYENCYEAWHVHSNTCFVILDHLCFLNAVLPPELKSVLPSEDVVQKAEDRILAANEKIQQEFFSQRTISKETVNECKEAADFGMYALNSLRRLLIAIKCKLYGLKYNGNRNKALKGDGKNK